MTLLFLRLVPPAPPLPDDEDDDDEEEDDDDEDEDGEAEMDEDEDDDNNNDDDDDDDDDDPYDSDATEPFCKIRKLTATTSSSSSSSSSSAAAGGGARRRNRSVIHASPPPLPLGSKALPFSCQVPDCDQAGVTFPGVTESDRRSAGEAHMKSKHQEYVDDFEKDGGRVCDTCGKGYAGKNARTSLSLHKKLHDSLDWKVCDFCPYSASRNGNVNNHILKCSMNPDRAPPTVKCKHCNEQVGVTSMSSHLASHHGIGKFYKCLFCDYGMYNKHALVDHIYNKHKDKPTITSIEAARAIVYADSCPFVMRNGSGSSGGKLRK